jgi:hypothetical protein
MRPRLELLQRTRRATNRVFNSFLPRSKSWIASDTPEFPFIRTLLTDPIPNPGQQLEDTRVYRRFRDDSKYPPASPPLGNGTSSASQEADPYFHGRTYPGRVLALGRRSDMYLVSSFNIRKVRLFPFCESFFVPDDRAFPPDPGLGQTSSIPGTQSARPDRETEPVVSESAVPRGLKYRSDI